MQNAETVLGVLRERGRRGLPCEELYRQLFNPQLYLLAYGRIYANKGAMTPGVTQETVDGMSMGKIGRIIDAMRHERYRFRPVRRVHIPKKNGKTRPLGLPTWSDKLVGEVVRLLLEAYYEPTFSDRSHGFRPGRGCHTALREVANTWTGTTWFIEGDIADCFGSASITSSCSRSWRRRSTTTGSCGWCGTCSQPDTWRTGHGAPRCQRCPARRGRITGPVQHLPAQAGRVRRDSPDPGIHPRAVAGHVTLPTARCRTQLAHGPPARRPRPGPDAAPAAAQSAQRGPG